jgi:amino-acid N-acetyltransferase
LPPIEEALTELIRNATIHDVPKISDIINSHAELGKMLFKSYAQLFEAIRDFAVFVDDATGEIVGCVALSVIWADLTEVRSLAVDEGQRGKGVGTRLVRWCIDEARRLGIRKLMSLTYEKRFFEKLGFEVVQKEALPLKVWSDCVKCPKNENCDEIAMVLTLHDVPVPELPDATPTPRGVSIPVLPNVMLPSFEDD